MLVSVSDFDAIATLTSRDVLGPHEAALLRELRGGIALDAGCGLGLVARELASRFERVDAIDLSPGMIAEARRRSSGVQFAVADLFDWLDAHRAHYDCIVSIATLHHVDEVRALRAMADALRPGGQLLVIDILDRPGVLVNGIAWIVARLRELRVGRMTRAEAAAWREHGRNERYRTWAEARELAAALPGAVARQHLLWRYSIAWTKRSQPSAAQGVIPS
jgi:2-polyprenyl-3-methyl-5-hydroxy-6-metoxy-1,4-benzoquinol methylase